VSGRGRPQLVIPASGANSLPRLPTFVEHGGEIACRHPADALQSRLYGFVLKADPDLLAAYCDRLFNRPTLGDEDWAPMGSELLLNFVDIPTMGSTDPLDRQLGVCHEREAAIWFPVIDRRRNRFAWAIPYMFVDSPLALAGGREVYGFPKQMGTLQIPVGRKAPSELSINTVTLEKHAPDSEAKDCRVITVKRFGKAKDLDMTPDDPARTLRELITAAGPGSVAAVRKGRTFRWLERLLSVGSGLLSDISADLLFFSHLVEEDVPMVLLKQFRDAHEPGAACYQAVIWVDMVVSEFRGGGLLPVDYRVEVEDLDGEPIMRELGVPESCRPRLAFWLDFDFVVQLGQILWEAARVRG
jgi:Acetoacetate decarboxylase (ADC)